MFAVAFYTAPLQFSKAIFIDRYRIVIIINTYCAKFTGSKIVYSFEGAGLVLNVAHITLFDPSHEGILNQISANSGGVTRGAVICYFVIFMG